MSTLFIGGPLDGRLVEIEDHKKNVEVAIHQPIKDGLMGDNLKKLTQIFYYKKEIIDCPGAEYPVFVPRSFTCEDVLRTLINGYHQGATTDSDD